MARTSSSTSRNPSKKRNQGETSLSDDSEPQRKIRKNNQKIRDERDDDDNQSVDQNSTTTSTSAENKKATKWCSYKSSVYRVDLNVLLNKMVTLSSYELFFGYEKRRDDIIKLLLKNYEATLMVEKDNTNRRSIDTHGQFHLNESIQYKRNQCKIVEDENCREAYLCVHSEEFSTRKGFKLPKNNDSLFFIDGWLIYRCVAMKSKNINAFNTIHGHMIGNKEDKKTLHWLGIHADHCTIRAVEHEISEIIDIKKEKSEEFQLASDEEIKNELAKLRATPIDEFIPAIINLNNVPSTAPVQSYYQPEMEQTQAQSFESEYNSVEPTLINETHTYSKPQETEYYTTTDSLPIVSNENLRVEDHDMTNEKDVTPEYADLLKNYDTDIIDEFDINLQLVSR